MSKTKFGIALFLTYLVSASVSFAVEFNYAELQIKTLDDMESTVTAQIKKSKKFRLTDDEASAKKALESAVEFVFSRPNHDNLVAQLMPNLKSELKELEYYNQALAAVVDGALAKLKDKKLKPRVRATQFFVLENFMSESKPQIPSQPEIKALFQKIADAKIEIADDVKKELRMRGMEKQKQSPSEIATAVLKDPSTAKSK